MTAQSRLTPARVRALREIAPVALDDWQLGGVRFSAELPELMRLALLSIRTPAGRPAAMPWSWVARGVHRPQAMHRLPPNTRGDVYCRCCGDLLASNVTRRMTASWRELPSREPVAGDEPQRHLWLCALLVAAGQLVPTPGARRIPLEYRGEA